MNTIIILIMLILNRNELNNLIRNLLKQQMEDVYTKINLNQSTQRNEIAIIVLQSFEVRSASLLLVGLFKIHEYFSFRIVITSV